MTAGRLGRPFARILFVTALTALLFYQVFYYSSFLALIKRQGGLRGEYGITFRDQAQAARWLMGRESPEGTSRWLALVPLSLVISRANPARSSWPVPATPNAWGGLDATLLISRLAYPTLDPLSARRIIWTSRSCYLLQLPASAADALRQRYPGPRLTGWQRVEEEKIRILALKLLPAAQSR